MGKIYFNPKTGKFWESSRYKRKPPEGFYDTGNYMNYNYRPRCYVAKSFYCPVCKEYHYIVITHAHSWDVPLWAREYMDLTKKYGCHIASSIVELARVMGGKYEHYRLAEKISHMGNFDRWYRILMEIKDNERRRKVAKMILAGKDIADIEVFLIAKELK